MMPMTRRLISRRVTDGELILLARDGNHDAFEAIYDRHSAAAYSLAYRVCARRADAEDVVQAAFLSLWRSRDRFDPSRGELRSWLLGIVHNSAIDRVRRTGVHERRRASSEGIEERLEAPGRTDEQAQAREQAAQVRRALGALPEEQRQVIELAYFDGLTHTQIAAKLEQPAGTVKGRMRLGLQKLHTQLADNVRALAPTGGHAEMSQVSNRNGHEHWEGDAAAYALGALEQHELRAFEQHLAGCPQCQRDLAVMRDAADALSMAAPRLVPEAELKQRVMSGVREEAGRQPAPADALASPRRRRRDLSFSWRRWRAPVFAMAAIAGGALVVLIVALSVGGGSSARTYAGVVNAPGATASLRVSGDRARLVFTRLPRLPAKLIYEMWLKRGAAAPVPAGALFAASSGAVDVPGDVRGVGAVLVTAEPRPSGTRKPTHEPIIVVRLT